MHRIDMVGLSHRDPHTDKRLRQAFEVLKPNVMTLEYPSDQESFENFWQRPEWQKKLKQIEIELGRSIFDKETNQVQVNAPYGKEAPVMQKIFEENRVSLFCVDDLQTKILIHMRLDYAAFFEAISKKDDDQDDNIYSLFEEHFHDNRVRHQLLKLVEDYKKALLLSRRREAFQRDRIREVLDDCSFKQIRLMHVGGLAHLADVKGYTTLYSLLKKVLPKNSFTIRRHSLRQFEPQENNA